MTQIGKVFISHASADKLFVDRLAADLAQRGVPIWYDRLDLKAGDSVPGKINEGLASSKYFLIVLSPRAVGSRWVQEELNAALVRQIAEAGTFLIPVLYQQCEIPPLVKHRRYVDFCQDYEAGLTELLDVFGKDAAVSVELEGKSLYPWPDLNPSGITQCYLHSTRFDKFFRLNCDLTWSVDHAINYIVETLKLPWNTEVSQLGMRWTFSYGIVFNGSGLILSNTLEQAGVSGGSVLKLSINGTYEDRWEKELRSMWDGSKMYEVGSAIRREQELKSWITNRGSLRQSRLKELADACFSHV